MRKPQRGRVGHTVVAGGVQEPNGIPWRSLVEVRGVNVTAFGELAFVPAVALNPLAGLGFRDSIANGLLNFGDASRVTQIQGINRVYAGKMKMRVNQSRGGRAAMQIHNVSGRPGIAQNGIFCADGQDFAVANFHRFCKGNRMIDRDYFLVYQHRVSLTAGSGQRRLGMRNSGEEKRKSAKQEFSHRPTLTKNGGMQSGAKEIRRSWCGGGAYPQRRAWKPRRPRRYCATGHRNPRRPQPRERRLASR